MSSTPPNMPPNMPPGGGAPSPYPPYDSKAQWRVYREQQKAAWRAQRDAWKAQQHAWRAGAAGVYGPRVPSVVGPIILIGVGVVALLLLTGHMNANVFWSWYGHWWPLLLIGAGLALWPSGRWTSAARFRCAAAAALSAFSSCWPCWAWARPNGITPGPGSTPGSQLRPGS